jgi:dihydropteroate synthase
LMHNARGGWLREGVLDSIKAYWERSVSLALEAGVTEDRIILDPGIGFTDTRDQDLKILRGLRELRCFGFPILLGSSRKRITGEPFGFGLEDRLETTLATTALGIEAGVDFVRVHDVKGNVRAAKMADLIVRA